tara:strand:+ start:140098 stop:140496 length:399 start_codon:yes stop_codon:yes gene_type:complete
VKFENKRKNHLKSKLVIDQLFSSGRALKKSPFRLVYLVESEGSFIGDKILVSVPKRNFKLAVSRNRIKRVISEIYRIHSIDLKTLLASQNRSLAIGIVYIGKKEPTYSEADQKIQGLLEELIQKLKLENEHI